MNAAVRITQSVEVQVFYFNCTECGAPLMDEYGRASGWCGCAPIKKAQRIERVVARAHSKETPSAPAGSTRLSGVKVG